MDLISERPAIGPAIAALTVGTSIAENDTPDTAIVVAFTPDRIDEIRYALSV